MKIGTIEAIGALTGVIFTALGELGGQLSSIIGTKPIVLKLYSINPIESNKMNDIEPNEVNRDFPLYEAKNICYKYGDKEILKT